MILTKILTLLVLSSILLAGCAQSELKPDPASQVPTQGVEPIGEPENPAPLQETEMPMEDKLIAGAGKPEQPIAAEQIRRYTDLTEAEWRARLTSLQYSVLWEKATERAFTGEYSVRSEPGTFVTAGCKIPVFRSEAQFDSGTGWPSFTAPITEDAVVLEEDNTLFTTRTEVLSSCGEHLGHVFDDGPAPTGKRYCMNAAALIFIPDSAAQTETKSEAMVTSETLGETMPETKATPAIATFAGGCFWCMEAPFEKIPGVLSVVSGYAGGTEVNPSYELVSSGDTKHIEAVQVTYDPAVVSYEKLLSVFWRQIDPTDSGGQFVDRGYQYTTAIFVHDPTQRMAAEESKQEYDAAGYFAAPIVTPIVDYTTFYPAEDYHQDYYRKSSIKYEFYRSRSGRDQFLTPIWGDNK